VLPVGKILTGANIGAYIHYPTMSNDMFAKIENRKPDYNNREIFTKNNFLFSLKIFYYKFFLFVYRVCGWFTDIAVANSNWTGSRIEAVWHRKPIDVLYPPAAIGSGDQIKDITSGEDKSRKKVLVSLAQFRPEKNHKLQILVFSKVLKRVPDAEFWVMGGARNDADIELLEGLKQYAKSLRIPDDKISYIANAEWSQVSSKLRQGMCAIHTMVDEHFGISLLEFLEAKLPVVAHRSGGPENDILLPDEKYGFLASTEDEFVEKITHVLNGFKDIKKMRIDAYNSLNRFMNDTQFGDAFAKYVLGK
jgi:alpha-1,2-mannosyltransferase